MPDRKAYGKQQAMPMMKEASGLEVQAKAFAYADYCTITDQFSRRADLDSSPDDNQHELFTSVSHCHWNTCPHSVVNFEDEQQRRSSSSRLARAHERAGRGRARRASKRGTEDTPCPVVVRSWRSVLWGDHVIDGEGNAGDRRR